MPRRLRERIDKMFRESDEPEIPGDAESATNQSRIHSSDSCGNLSEIELGFEQLSLSDVIGKGNFGKVHAGTLSTSPGLGSNNQPLKVAVKVFDPDQMRPAIPIIQRSDQLKVSECNINTRLFLREAQILRQVEHPHIVKFFGCIVKSPFFAIVMELCEGSAAELREVGKRLKLEVTWRRALRLLRETADAIHYLHELKPCILHRDIKGENILIGQDFGCRLSDFGFSRFKENGEPNSMTLCGTPYWLAPEVFRKERYTEKIDVYSFGLVIWEMCYSRKPFQDVSILQLSYAVGVVGRRPDVDSHLPQPLHHILQACCDQNPSQRPSFFEVLKELDSILDSGAPFLLDRLPDFESDSATNKRTDKQHEAKQAVFWDKHHTSKLPPLPSRGAT